MSGTRKPVPDHELTVVDALNLFLAVDKACALIEMADARLLAHDGPVTGHPPDMSLSEWRRLYLTLNTARRLAGK